MHNERRRQIIPTIPYSDAEETLDMSVDDLSFEIAESDAAEKIAESLDAGRDVALDIENPVHRAGILLHVQAPLSDEMR